MKYHPKRQPLDRRTFLRGTLAGTTVSVGLPFLESMAGSTPRTHAESEPEEPPNRYVFTFCGSSLGCSRADDEGFVPDREGLLEDNLSPALEPLKSVTDHVTLVSNLRIPYVTEEGASPPPGGRGAQFHGVAQGPLLTGVRASEPSINGKTSDQVVADAWDAEPFVVRAQADLYAPGYGIGHNKKSISYGEDGETAVDPIVNPHIVYERMFGTESGWTPPDLDAEERSLRQKNLYERRSVLDGIKNSYERLKKKASLSRNDRKRLKQHFAQIRQMEKQLAELAEEQEEYGLACEKPDEPKEDWVHNTDRTGWSNEDKRAEALTDLVYYALVCNRTQVAGIQYTLRQSFLSAKPMVRSNRDANVHALGHSDGRYGDVIDIQRWHLQFYTKLVDRLANAREADGSSVLDHTVALYVPEGGHGFNPEGGSDSSPHSTENMAVLVAGKPDKLVNGMHIEAPDDRNHPANTYISAMDAVGVPNNHELGEIQGVIPSLMKS
jgi:hypothetical protein